MKGMSSSLLWGKSYQKEFIILLINSLIGASAVIVQAYYMGEIVNHVDYGVNIVLPMFFIILATMIVEIISNGLQSFRVSKYENKKKSQFYNMISEKLLKVRVKELDKKSEGEILSLINGEVDGIMSFPNYFFGIGYIPLKILIPVILMLHMNPRIAILIIVSMVIALVPGMLVGNKQYEMNKKVGRTIDLLNGNFIKIFDFMKIIKANNAEELYVHKNGIYVNEYSKEKRKLMVFVTILNTLNRILGILPYLTLYLVGGYFALKGKIRVGDIISASFYVGILSDGLGGLQNFQPSKQRYRSAKERLGSILELDEMEEIKIKKQYNSDDIILEFNNVTFAYEEGKSILNNVSFKVKYGSKVMVVGSSGNGKSTLFRLITGLSTPNLGQVSAYTSRKDEVGSYLVSSVAGQESVLLSKTVKENITIVNPNLTDKEFEEICKIVHLDESILLQDGKVRRITEIGKNLSKGQFQRINLARALAKKADLYLFDEPTSGLSIEMQEEVTTNILEYLKDKTVIFISHTTKQKDLFDEIMTVSNKYVTCQVASAYELGEEA